MKLQDTSVNKLGTARVKGERVARSRIWLQGNRLREAGFTPGMTYYSTFKNDGTLELNATAPSYAAARVEVRKVSGKGDVPIIDIVGAHVRDFFTASHVEVSYYAGRIVIKEAA